MIERKIYIDNYDWEVHIFYHVTCYWTDRIMDCLKDIECPADKLRKSYKLLSSCESNTGITYSNYRLRSTVMVICDTSSSAQFVNSLDHERKHLEAHIAQAFNIPPYGEEIAYLSGDIGQLLAKDMQMFICDCDCCKNKVKRLIR